MKLTKLKDHEYLLEGTEICGSCDGTGLYCGMAEGKGAAVVCHSCNGTGASKVKMRIHEFTKRKEKKDVKRVYHTAGGYGIGCNDVTTKEGVFHPFSQYGCSYEEWLNGAKPKPIESLHCPYQHTAQGLQSNDVNGLYKSRCSDNLGFGYITNCKLRKDMAKCWQIYKGGKS